jgi:hypothetical protein
MSLKFKKLTLPLTTLTVLLAVALSGYAAQGRKEPALQKRRVAARGHLTGTREFQQIITWQTANPAGGMLPYAKAHLAIETDAHHVLWQTDGGKSQYLVDDIQLEDLDGDGTPEIISLWQEGASAGYALRVFHWERRRHSFVELKAADDLSGVHRYQIDGPSDKRRIVTYVRSDVGSGWPAVEGDQYEARGNRLARVKGGGGMPAQGEAGVTGEVFISPVHPGPIRQGDTSSKKPYQATLAFLTVEGGREVARLQTGEDGRFRVSLPPGEYRIVPVQEKPGRFLPRAGEELVKVLPGQFAHVTIEYDSGMR